MAALTSNDSILRPQRDVRLLLVKWIVALFVPIAVFTFIWSGEEIINNVFLGLMNTASSNYDTPTLIQAAIFIALFYATIIAFVGYLVAADSGRRRMIEIWIDVLIFAVVPLLLVVTIGDLFISLAFSAIIWIIFLGP